MPYNIRIVSTYPPRRCGIGTFSRDLATALAHFTSEVGNIRVAAIDNGNGPYDIPVDLVIDQYNPQSWRDAVTHISTRADEAKNPTVIALQHEFGLDPSPEGKPGAGSSFVNLARAFHERGLDHRRLPAHGAGGTQSAREDHDPEPGPAQRRTDRDDGKRHPDPRIGGVRRSPTRNSSTSTTACGCTIPPISTAWPPSRNTTWRTVSSSRRSACSRPAKGSNTASAATACSSTSRSPTEQRKRDGLPHRGQMSSRISSGPKGGEPYRRFRASLDQALEQAKVKWCKVKELGGTNFDEYDIVFLDTFLDETHPAEAVWGDQHDAAALPEHAANLQRHSGRHPRRRPGRHHDEIPLRQGIDPLQQAVSRRPDHRPLRPRHPGRSRASPPSSRSPRRSISSSSTRANA